jgi:hypothetical protein
MLHQNESPAEGTTQSLRGAANESERPHNPDSITRAEADARRLALDELLIDEAGIETFPASDPPSWSPLITGHHGRPHGPGAEPHSVDATPKATE